jgi:hypothetical protein
MTIRVTSSFGFKPPAEQVLSGVDLSTKRVVVPGRSIGGRSFEDCREAPIVTVRPSDSSGVAQYAVDPGNARRPWEIGLQLIDEKVS